MAKVRWERPDEFDHVLLLADDDDAHREAIREHLARVPGRQRADVLGRYPRFKIVTAADGAEALRRASAQVTAAAIDLVMPRRNGLEVIQELRARRQDLALLAFTAAAPASEAVAAVMAGADFFYEWRSEEGYHGLERALELAIDRRRLARLIEKNEAEVEAARGRLAQLSGDLARSLPGFRPPHTRQDVVPFSDAAKRYLTAAARLYEGDARALADSLGLSYFALRRLLAKYGVPFPRSRGHGTSSR
ncbi:MAG TPA: response regulator [Anaeromyxobacteraceae bacterium]|nr:response regulator [Anaeromyxobacteraceae bacterium]